MNTYLKTFDLNYPPIQFGDWILHSCDGQLMNFYWQSKATGIVSVSSNTFCQDGTHSQTLSLWWLVKLSLIRLCNNWTANTTQNAVDVSNPEWQDLDSLIKEIGWVWSRARRFIKLLSKSQLMQYPNCRNGNLCKVKYSKTYHYKWSTVAPQFRFSRHACLVQTKGKSACIYVK